MFSFLWQKFSRMSMKDHEKAWNLYSKSNSVLSDWWSTFQEFQEYNTEAMTIKITVFVKVMQLTSNVALKYSNYAIVPNKRSRPTTFWRGPVTENRSALLTESERRLNRAVKLVLSPSVRVICWKLTMKLAHIESRRDKRLLNVVTLQIHVHSLASDVLLSNLAGMALWVVSILSL